MEIKRLFNHSEKIDESATIVFQDGYAIHIKPGDHVILTVLVVEETKDEGKEGT